MTSEKSCCDLEKNFCRIEAMISIDERGQMVLPKDVRDKAKIHAGDKMAVVSWGRGDEVCCIALLKADQLTAMVKDVIKPVMEQIA
jgi:antitoxin PrlF